MPVTQAFDKFLLIGCICVVLSLTLYFFYWNRLIAFLLGWFFRFLYWNQGPFSIWLEIGSIHFSILTGRILIKDFRYHSSNQTIKIVRGSIEWRWWIRRPASGDDISPAGAMNDPKQARSASCRVQISLQGFEWFLCNRTAAYDAIVTQMGAKLPSRPVSRNTGHQSPQRSVVPGYSASVLPGSLRLPVVFQRAWHWVRRQLPTLDPKDLLPLGIEVTKGAIICGNPSTPNLLVAEFGRTEGMFGIVQSRSKYDLYKQLLHLSFEKALIRYAQNEDYRGQMVATGELLKDSVKKYSKVDQIFGHLSHQTFAKLWRHLKLYAASRKFPTNDAYLNHSAPPRSHGKHKSLDEDTPIGADFATFEYAIDRKILEAPVLELTYYTDVVGDVPSLPHPVDTEPGDIGNGDIGPEWGIDLVVRGGFLRYGPWADRQRSELQKAFFPPTYQNAEETPHLKPGDKRVWTAMQVFIELRDDTTLHIPFREASKNWQWDGQTNVQRRPKKREPASIHVTVGDRSSINYIVPMVASAAGYESVVEVHLDTVEVTSSLNDIRLVSAESCRIRGELPSPLEWNARRTWKVGISLRQPVLYLLRDHINMFTDLGRDWAAGPPSDYQRFVPTVYTVELELHHYELNMYVNDHNIIDKPLIRDENALLTARGTRLQNITEIPSDTFRPESTTIPFSVEIPDVSLNLSLPRWNTWALHAPKDGHNLAKVRVLKLDGFFRYFSEVREDNVEQLKLTITTRDLAYKGLGWSIRYFMILQTNYFGSFTTFSTLFEYLEKRKKGMQGDPVLQQYRKGQSNKLQVELDVDLQNGLMVIPAGLPGYESSVRAESLHNAGIGSCVLLDIPELQVHLRLHDFFMELSLNIGTITGCIEADFPERMAYSRPKRRPKEVVVIDGIDITSNRLFGPQPRTMTYVCIWEIGLGVVKAVLSARDATILSSAGTAFGLNFDDLSNAPAATYAVPVPPDVTFLKFSLAALDVTWRVDHAALLLSLPDGLHADVNDAGGQFHRNLTSLRVPRICVKFLLRSLAENRRWLEVCEMESDAYVDIYSSPIGWRKKAADQAAFIEEQDLLTGRAKRMFARLESDKKARLSHLKGVFLPQPELSDHRRYQSKEGLTTGRPPVRQAEKRSPWQKVARLSESDSGEDILDTDRDARLAKTRTETPIPLHIPDKDEAMSEGDESDTEDLSEGTSSDDNWSDSNTVESGSTAPALKQYSRLCRQYVAPHLDSPFMWEGPPFSLLKSRRGPSSTPKSEAPGYTLPPPPNLDIEPREDCKTTVFRFSCRKGLEVTITPLVVTVITSLEGDLADNIMSPELSVDSILASYLGSFGRPKESAPTTVFDIRLSSVHVDILHEVKLAENDNARSLHKSANALGGLNNIARLSCHVDDVHVIGTKKQGGTIVDGRFAQVVLALNPNITGRSPEPTEKPIFHLAITTSVLTLSKDNPEAVLGGITLQLSQQSLEYMMALGIGLSQTMRQLSATYQKWKRRNSTTAADIVQSILYASHDNPVIDPLSTIQPSFLVQSGTPHTLRIDTIFRFLFHLRNCLWELRDGVSVLPKPDIELGPLLESRLATLDPDVFHDGHLSSLHPLFPTLKEPARDEPTSVPYPTTSASLELHRFTVLLRDPSGGVTSEFMLTDLVCNVRLRTSDFVETLPGHQPMGISQVSLRHQPRQRHQHISLSISTQEIHLTISPRLMPFAQEVLRVKRRYSGDLVVPKSQAGRQDSPYRTLEVVTNMHRLRLEAAAESLVFEFGLSGFQVVSSVLLRPHHSAPRTMSFSVVFSELFLRARSPADASIRSLQDILASITFTVCKINSLVRFESTMASQIRLAFSIGGFHFNVPRSALRLYRFAQEWRADYLPGIEATVKDLLSELHRAPLKPLSPTPSRSTQRSPTLHLHGEIQSFGVSLQVMHGTWLSWRVFNVILYLNSLGALKQTFGLRLASQIFSITAKSNTQDVNSSTKLKVEFPSLSLCGDYNGTHVQIIALVDFLEFKVKPVHWDTLLAVQQKFGQDFNDLVVLVQETRSSAPTPKASPKGSQWKYAGFLKMRGFRIGLEGLSSTFYLECFDISGSIDNLSRRMWSLKLTDLALSLAPKAAVEPGNSVFNRHRRSAFVIIDFEVKGEDGAEQASNSILQIAVTKIHAIMQASSIGEVGDFIDHLQAELRDRKEQRAIELAAFKEKAQSILKTFEVPVEDVRAKEQSFWQSYVIKLSVSNIGVAFPLTHDQNLEIPQTGSGDSTAVKAFLFSVKSIKFGTQRGESGEAKMQGLSIQFVSRFRQSVASDFAGDTHQTRNRLLYPEMTAHLRSVGLTSSRNIWMRASVSGFILDIDSTIPEYIFSLIDVYEQGKERVSRLSASIPRNASSSASPESEQYTALPTSNVFASLTFLSGKVRVFNKAASALSRTSSLSHVLNQPSDEQMLDMGADVFNLPVVSVWAEYRATPASHKVGMSDSEPSILVFKSTIHSSQNTLRPTTLLPFLAELVSQVEALMRRASRSTGPALDTSVVSETGLPPAPLKKTDGSATPQKFQIIFSLRIDQSKLEFTCQPDVNVIAGLHWDSGGFVLHFFPGARKVTLTGSIGGLSVGLKHGFLSEECAKLDMRNLTFSVTFAKTGYGTGRAISSVSFILDTEILGAVRLSRLQDILCFKAVWLDRIPVFNHMSAEVKPPNKSASTPAPRALPAQEFTTVLLVRVRQISLEVDLGQSISTITLDLKDAIARTKLTEELSEVSLYVTDVAIVARGNLSGHSSVSNCVFRTVRRMQNSSQVGGNRMLELRMTSDALIAVLESDHQKLLHYRAEPLEVEIFDDWSLSSPDVQQAGRTVRFSVTVESPEIVAVVTVGTIPKLLSYANKFKANLEAQREGASRESKTFHLSRTPNPDNPLSAVAEAMLHSARSKFKEADSELSYIVRQHMSLRLGTLRLVVFPRTMGDLEIAQFIGRDVCAQLERLVELRATPPKRSLELSFSFMTISRFTQLGHLAPPTILSDGREWLTSLLKDAAEANIVGLPSMHIHMVSEEGLDRAAKVLEYDFNSRFNRQGGTQSFEDIYISLNVSLYSWLTLLRKNLSREMDQVRATAEWRTSVAAAAPVRRKALESSATLDAGKTVRAPVKSATLGHPIQLPPPEKTPKEEDAPVSVSEKGEVVYRPRKRHIERLTMRQLGEATPDVMHPFFMKKAGFNLEDSLPQYVNEYATGPLENIMEVLLKLYSRQLLAGDRERRA